MIGWNKASLHLKSQASSVSLLAHFHKILVEVDQPVLDLHRFRNLTEEKINMASVNMSKGGPIICVNISMLRQNDSLFLQLFIP